MIEVALAAVVGAIGNRVRGGMVPVPGGTQVGRLVGWALPSAVVAWVVGAPVVAAGFIGILAMLGCMAGQFGGLAMGMRGPAPKLSPWVTMQFWGFCRVLGPVVVLGVLERPWMPLLVAGLLCPAIYRAVWFVPGEWLPRGFGYGHGKAEGYDPPQLAEAVHGAAMMGAMVWGLTHA